MKTAIKALSLLLLALPLASPFQVNSNRNSFIKTQQSASTIGEQLTAPAVLLPEPTSEPNFHPVPTQVAQGYSNPGISTWARRLNTKGDFMASHKISGMAFVVLSTIILGTGVVTGGQVPDFLEPATYLFAITMLVQMVSSIEMSFQFRSDPSERRTMIGNALLAGYSGVLSVWSSSFAPDFMDIPCVSKAINLGFGIPILLTIVDSIVHANESLEVKKGNDVEKNYWVNFAVFMLPMVIAIFTGSYSIYLFGFEHDRAWFLDLMDSGVLDRSVAFYNPVVNAVYASYMSLLWTLRDRKLISRQQEQTANAFLATVQFIFVLASFGPIVAHELSF